MVQAWRKRTENEVIVERSSGPCLAAANRTKDQSGAEQ